MSKRGVCDKGGMHGEKGVGVHGRGRCVVGEVCMAERRAWQGRWPLQRMVRYASHWNAFLVCKMLKSHLASQKRIRP